MKLKTGFKLSISGDGYSEVISDEGRTYIHRLSAVAEHGFEAVRDKDVHHEGFKWVNNPSKLTPENSEEHRKRTLKNVESDNEEVES
jgi:hypothetical protein